MSSKVLYFNNIFIQITSSIYYIVPKKHTNSIINYNKKIKNKKIKQLILWHRDVYYNSKKNVVLYPKR